MACWKCGNGVQDESGFCRMCGRDVLAGPPRPPTVEELRVADLFKVQGPTYRSTRGRAQHLIE